MPLQTGKTLGLAALTVMALLLIAALGTRGAGAEETAMMPSSDDGAPLAVATFAGGCFWCMEPPFEKLDGVKKVVSGYTGGKVANPTYEQVSEGGTGHAEAVEITYDPARVSYKKLLYIFWRNTDPLRKNAQFCDVGNQYRTAIFTHGPAQKKLAEESKAELEKSGRFDKPIRTRIVEAGPFYPAETYHQDYYRKNPLRYKFYRWNCGRDQRLDRLWGDEARGGEPAEH
ncbi:peptide-methionine (S)-S-oxide reductase [Parvibaculum indicum]|uniref:peptide-methionine (S)-S-oxide reductase MsrA n=1 Tax=Parvibaculum indicum TaxID=562969 RepID=UPI0014239694|nr:peptide-methionine (S)-S-oxide reductase MsrA [Parvibaculum indicum]NIJ41365.1 peptide-methionine (S)-S-oxide reductase [Parvibaculum indicum]